MIFTNALNHHGDGSVALWLNALPNHRELHVAAEPSYFFVPPYVGPRGWLGVTLDRGIDWKQVIVLVREAYEKVAPPVLRARIGKMPMLKAPSKTLSADEIDPLKSPRALAVLAKLRKLCMQLPESREGGQFGHPLWQAGKKSFALARLDSQRHTLCVWAGAIGKKSTP